MHRPAEGGLGATPSVPSERDDRAQRDLSSKVAAQSPYRVEAVTAECVCGEGCVYRYEVIGPDGDAQGVTFEDEVDAQEHAEALSGAFQQGQKAADEAAADLLASLREIVAEWGSPNTPKWHRAKAAIAKAEARQ